MVDSPAEPDLGTLARYGIGVASLGAGVIHLSAVHAHTEHLLILSFFVVSGVLQLLFGTAVLAGRFRHRVLEAGALLNVAFVAIWVITRTSGLAFIAGAERPEPIGVKDSVAVLLEVLIVGGAVALATGGGWLTVRVTREYLTPFAVAAGLVLVAGIASPPHQHMDGDEHMHELLAAGHADAHAGHGADAVAHGHAVEVAGDHAHGGHTSATHSGPTHTHTAAPANARSTQPAPKPPAVKGIDASAKYGPFVLPPASAGGDAHYNRVLTGVAKPCTDCYLISMKPDLVYADGSSANFDTGPMLHHVVWTRPSIADTTCGRGSAIGSQGERFFASGNERTVMKVPSGFGYHIGNDPWNLIVEVMNHSDQARSVYITLDVKYVKPSNNVHDVTPVWMDVNNCGDSQYYVPAGKSKTDWAWTSTITGRVVSAGGHVHNGGLKTTLRNATTKQQMCTSVAGYGTKPAYKGNIESMNICSWDRIGTVRTGQDLEISAYYNSPEEQDDVMGIVVAYVYETSNLTGGTAPPNQSTPEESQSPQGGHQH